MATACVTSLCVGCNNADEPTTVPEDPEPPAVFQRLEVPLPTVDPVLEVCMAYTELKDQNVPSDELMKRTAERALERGGTPVRIYTEQWGALLPAELYLQVQAFASGREECAPFLAFLRTNVDTSHDEIAAFRRQLRANKQARIEASRRLSEESTPAPGVEHESAPSMDDESAGEIQNIRASSPEPPAGSPAAVE